MNAPLSIAAEAPALLPRFGRTLASLPVSYVPAAQDTVPHVMLVSGEGEWAQRSADAIGKGCRAIIVTDPGMAAADSIAALADLAERSGVVIELAERYAGDATLQHHRHDLAQHLLAASTIIVTQIGPFGTPAAAALDMVRTLRALGQAPVITSLWTIGQSVAIRGTTGAMLVEGLATAGSAATGQRVQALGFSRTLRLTLPGDGDACPADIRIANMKGERKLPGLYESADRAAWRRVLAALASGRSDVTGLRLFAQDVAMIGRL